MRTVGGQASSWTKDGRCCGATTQTPSFFKDFDELLHLVQQVGWVEPIKPREYWTTEKNTE